LGTLNIYTDQNTAEIETEAKMDSAFHFWPQSMGSEFVPEETIKTDTASRNDFPSLLETYPTQYWSASTGFGSRPRENKAEPIFRSTDDFDRGFKE